MQKNKGVDIDIHAPVKERVIEDGTPLESACHHYPYGKLSRYKCVNCIIQWVEAVCEHAATEKAQELVDNGKKIASERVLVALKEKKKRNAK